MYNPTNNQDSNVKSNIRSKNSKKIENHSSDDYTSSKTLQTTTKSPNSTLPTPPPVDSIPTITKTTTSSHSFTSPDLFPFSNSSPTYPNSTTKQDSENFSNYTTTKPTTFTSNLIENRIFLHNKNSSMNENDVSITKIYMKLSQMIKCLKQLKVSNSSESKFVYSCHKWKESPNVILWVFIFIFCFLYLVFPIILSLLYILNIKGRLNSCFLYSEKDGHYYEKRNSILEKEKVHEISLNNILSKIIFFLITAAILGGTLFMFLESTSNLSNIETTEAILKIQTFR